MTTPTQERWQRLGGLLIQRRVELDPRYRYRNAFADAAGLDWRLLYDIEKGRRTNFGRATITAIEVAYRLQPGSIGEFLDDAEDTLIPLPAPEPEPEPEYPPFDDPVLQRMWDENKDEMRHDVLYGALSWAAWRLRQRRRDERHSA